MSLCLSHPGSALLPGHHCIITFEFCLHVPMPYYIPTQVTRSRDAGRSPVGTGPKAGVCMLCVCLAPRTREVWRGSGHCDSQWALASLLRLWPGLTVSTELCPPAALITSYSMSPLECFILAHTLAWFGIPFLCVVCGQLYNLKLNFTASSQCNLLRKGYLM